MPYFKQEMAPEQNHPPERHSQSRSSAELFECYPPEVADILLSRTRTEVGMQPLDALVPAAGNEEGDGGSESPLTADAQKVLSSLKGHSGRYIEGIVRTSRTTEATQILQGAEYIDRLAGDFLEETVPMLEPASISFDTELVAHAKSSREVYEYLRFLDAYPHIDRKESDTARNSEAAKALGLPETAKWNDILDVVFCAEPDLASLRNLISAVGSIPSDLYTKKKFKNLSPEVLASTCTAIRALEQQMPNDAIQYERSTFLNHVFRSRNAEKFKQLGRTSVTLDSNGMFVQFRGIQSHIPYGLIDLETIDALSAGKWLSESDIIELKVRRAEEAVDTLGFCTAKIEQLHATARIFNIAEHEQSDVQELLLQRLTHDPYAFATTLIEQGAVIPDILIDHLTMHGTKHEIHQLTVCAEAVGDLLSGTYLQQDILRKTNYLTLGEDAGAYEARARLLNDPRYYGATKIAKKLLQGGALSEDMNEEFFAFVADYKKGVKSGDQHAFLETVENGHVSRILLNADKHVGPYEQQTFARLPRYERSTYESLERALRVYEHYVRSLQLLEAFNPDQCTTGEWVARHENIKDWLHFTLTNVTSRYASVEQAYQAWRQEAKARVGAVDTEQHTEGNRVGEVPAYRALLHELRAVCGQYEQYLHSNILNPSSFNERFDPNIDKRELVFDPALVEKAQAFVPAANIDEELTRTAPPVRIALLHYSENDPSQTLPMHATQGALDAIRIDRGRPLINVVGGAKYTGQESHILFQTVARSVVSVGHDIKANIGVPGTQSGVGLEFGRANAQYRAAHEHLLHRDKAHMFAINPAGNTYVPDNPYLAEADMNAVYMNNAVDSILTPVRVEWNKRGKERRNSKYKTFISHMELLHDAVSQGNERVAIVLNGGLYTVWEVNELIKHEFDLMLVQGTGRFADAAYEFTYSRVACYGFDADMDDVAFGAFVIEKIQRGMLPEAANEFLEKDFGTVANLTEIPDIEQRETYQVYRDAFREFLTHISKGYFSEVTASSVEEVGDQLGAYFSEGNKAWRASRPPQEFI